MSHNTPQNINDQMPDKLGDNFETALYLAKKYKLLDEERYEDFCKIRDMKIRHKYKELKLVELKTYDQAVDELAILFCLSQSRIQTIIRGALKDFETPGNQIGMQETLPFR